MQYRILLVTSLSKPWNNGWYYKTGFEKNGHEVRCFDARALSDPSREIFRVVGEYRPDFLLHTKDELPPQVFRGLMERTRVVQWYPDPIIDDEVKSYAAACHVFLTMSEGLVKSFKEFNRNVFWLSQGFEPSFFEIDRITPNDQTLYAADLTFVGNLGSKSQYLCRREYLKRTIQQGFSLKWWGPPIPRKLSNIPLIFGKIGRSYGGKFVWGPEYAKVARFSKIFMAFDSQPEVRKSMSARMYTAVGCGAFYMCLHVDGIEEVLRPGKEIVTFRSEDDMLEKLKYYIDRNQERKAIAEAGRNRVMKEHTYETRTHQLIELLESVL